MEADTYICPTCGTEVRVGGKCEGCQPAKRPRRRRVAASARKSAKSWEQDEALDGLDLPDGGIDYDDFVAREFSRTPHRKIGIKLYHWITAVVLVVLLVLMALGGVFG